MQISYLLSVSEKIWYQPEILWSVVHTVLLAFFSTLVKPRNSGAAQFKMKMTTSQYLCYCTTPSWTSCSYPHRLFPWPSSTPYTCPCCETSFPRTALLELFTPSKVYSCSFSSFPFSIFPIFLCCIWNNSPCSSRQLVRTNNEAAFGISKTFTAQNATRLKIDILSYSPCWEGGQNVCNGKLTRTSK